MTREIRNARISGTFLGVEDHGILTAYVNLEWQGGGQSFGGYALDEWSPGAKTRFGTAYGMEFVKRTIATVGAASWEAMKGKHVRIDHDWGKVYSIGHITDDEWFTPEEDLARFLAEKIPV